MLEALVENEALDHDELDTYCAYCQGWQHKDQDGIEHSPDCPWLHAKQYVDEQRASAPGPWTVPAVTHTRFLPAFGGVLGMSDE